MKHHVGSANIKYLDKKCFDSYCLMVQMLKQDYNASHKTYLKNKFYLGVLITQINIYNFITE